MEKPLALALGKLMLSVAWIDGTLQNEELRLLHELLHRLPNLSTRDHALLRLYTEFPITEDERDAIVREFQNQGGTHEQRLFALKMLKDVVEADGEITGSERELYMRLRQRIESGPSFLDILRKTWRSLWRTRHTPGLEREKLFETYFENPALFRVNRIITEQQFDTGMGPEQLRAAVLGALLLAAPLDWEDASGSEQLDALKSCLRHRRGYSEYLAGLLVGSVTRDAISENDILRFAKDFSDLSTQNEREALFVVVTEMVRTLRSSPRHAKPRLRVLGESLGISQEFVQQHLPSS